ncbi:MAG: alpha/beta hydrolase [bacterium]
MKLVITLVVVAGLLVLFIRLMENKLIFFPFKYPRGYWQPDSLGMQVEECFFNTADGLRLHGWLLQRNSSVPTLLWCHGNAGNITDRLDNLARLAKLPLNIFIFDYRGYGKSEGSPNEAGVYRDAEAAFDYLNSRKDIDAQKIILFGRSLGGAVAVDLATKRPCAAVILESTFTSARDMAKAAFGLIPIHLIIKTKFNSLAKIRNIQVPLLCFHGSRDSTVPFKLGRKLFEAANQPKEFYPIQNADHNDTYLVGGSAYFEKIQAFIESQFSNDAL